MIGNSFWVRYYLNLTNIPPGSDKPQILALQIANISKMPMQSLEEELIREGFSLYDYSEVNGIEMLTFTAEKSIEVFAA
jgi:hypothetical protein